MECPYCESTGRVEVWVPHTFKYGVSDPPVLLEAGVVPVWKCEACGECTADWRVEEARDTAVARYLMLQVQDK